MQDIWGVKQGAFSWFMGLSKFYHHFIGGNCAVLLYHRVSEYETDPQLLCVTPENFDKQIVWLKNNFRILSIEEFKEHIKSHKKFPARSVVITFDDGYADNYQYALPILEKHSVQALFYICTGNLGSDREFWWDEVERIVLLSSLLKGGLRIRINHEEYLCTDDVRSRNIFYEQILPVIRIKTPVERESLLEKLRIQTDGIPPRRSHRSMTWDELKRMADSLSAVIGAHTHRHPSLAALTIQEQKKEIQESKTLLESNLGRKIQHFSYPFGTRKDFTSDTVHICKEEGFETVCANFPFLAHSQTNPYKIPRFLVRDWELEKFKKEMKKIIG